MKLAHAVRVGEKCLDRHNLSAEEVIALTVLTRFAKRVLAAKESLRALARAVAGDDDLNQNELPLGGEPKE